MGGDDWDLEAVVRSCRFSGSPPATATTAATAVTAATATRDPFSSFPAPFPVDEEEGLGEGNRFPDLLGGSRTISYGLEELCKPFFSKPQQQLQTKPSNSPAAPPAAAPTKPAQQQHRPAHHRPVSQIPRSKRRKNQQKKVVCHVPADGLASDMWAWRKYGQKPIKGSPYPRGYYRCSSSKGCQARKQVERSRADPGILVITYTAEHNHPVPTHRNSLAGSTRSKISTFSAGEQSQLLTGSGSPLSSPTAASGLSPTTPLNASMEDELLRRQAEKSGDEEEDDDEEEEEEEELMVEDMEMAGDGELLFVGIDGEETEIKGNATAVEGSAAFEDRFFSAFLAG